LKEKKYNGRGGFVAGEIVIFWIGEYRVLLFLPSRVAGLKNLLEAQVVLNITDLALSVTEFP